MTVIHPSELGWFTVITFDHDLILRVEYSEEWPWQRCVGCVETWGQLETWQWFRQVHSLLTLDDWRRFMSDQNRPSFREFTRTAHEYPRRINYWQRMEGITAFLIKIAVVSGPVVVLLGYSRYLTIPSPWSRFWIIVTVLFGAIQAVI